MKHLQNQEASTDNNSKQKHGNEVEEVVKGLGKQFKYFKRRESKSSCLDCADFKEQDQPTKIKSNGPIELEKHLSKEAFLRLKESGTGLHLKVCDMFRKW